MLLSKPIRTDDDQNFKLMAIPEHARKIVILNMGAVQMYLISRCSSKMKNLLKKYINHIQFALQIDIDKSIVFIIKAEGVGHGSFEVKCLDLWTGQNLFASGNFDEITMFWSNVFDGASCMYKNLLDRFPCQMRLCRLPSKEDSIDIRRLIGWTNTLEPKLTDIGITIPESIPEIETQIYHLIETLEQLHSINISFDSERHYNALDSTLNDKGFFVHCAEWITLNHLFKFDGASLFVINVRLTDGEINGFLRAYVRNETNQNLEHMALTVNRRMDKNTAFDGLSWSNVGAEDARPILENGIAPELTTEDFARIVMRNNQTCYVNIGSMTDETTLLYLRNFKDEVFKPFKLMKLPNLAVERVIKNMSLMEAFNLSLCSPTLRYFVKHFFKKQKFKLIVKITDFFMFGLTSPDGTSVFFGACKCPEDLKEVDDFMRMKIGRTSNTPFYYRKPELNYLVTYWRNTVNGATELYSLILELFNIHFEQIVVWKEKITVDYGSVVEWINRINRPIEDAHFDHGSVDDALYSQTIQSENFRKCVIWQKPSENFTSPEFRFTDAHVNWVIHNAHWITLKNLSEIGSACLSLKGVKFTNQEVNSFFKTLITGKFRNLEFISLGFSTRNISQTAVMDGLTDPENNELNRNVRVFDRYGYNLTVQGTHDVRMATGESCSFKFFRITNEDGVHSGVYAFIWK